MPTANKSSHSATGTLHQHCSLQFCLCPNAKFHLRLANRYCVFLFVPTTDVVIVKLITSPCVTAVAASICCDKAKTSAMLLHFCTFLLKPNIDLELDYIHRKPMNCRFQQYILHTEILTTFHARVKFISVKQICH